MSIFSDTAGDINSNVEESPSEHCADIKSYLDEVSDYLNKNRAAIENAEKYGIL